MSVPVESRRACECKMLIVNGKIQKAQAGGAGKPSVVSVIFNATAKHDGTCCGKRGIVSAVRRVSCAVSSPHKL